MSTSHAEVKYLEILINWTTEELQKGNFISLYEENKAKVVHITENKAVAAHIVKDN